MRVRTLEGEVRKKTKTMTERDILKPLSITENERNCEMCELNPNFLKHNSSLV